MNDALVNEGLLYCKIRSFFCREQILILELEKYRSLTVLKVAFSTLCSTFPHQAGRNDSAARDKALKLT